MKLFYLGIKDDITPYKKVKIKLTNQVSILCAFIGVCYSALIFSHYPELMAFPVSIVLMSCLLLLLNHNGFVGTARFLASFQMLALVYLLHASILPAKGSLFIPFEASMLPMTLIPWLLYGPKEKLKLFVSFGICISLLLSMHLFNYPFETAIDVPFFSESYTTMLSYATAIGLAGALILMMKRDKSSQLV